MKKIIVPFISQLPLNEQHQWVKKLNVALTMKNILIQLSSNLTATEVKHCKMAIVANPSEEQLQQYLHLIWIQSLWAGVENLATSMVSTKVNIVRLVDPCLAQTMAEAVLTWCFYLHRDMHQYVAQQKRRLWQQSPVKLANERNIGLLGLGELGQVSAQKLTQNGFNVFGWSRQLKSLPNIQCFSGESGLHHILSNSDIIVILLPLTNETQYLFNEKRLSLMKKGASIINFARGKIIHLESLLSALNHGKLAHAVLDVFEQEPLPKNDPLWLHPKVTVLPHISAPTNKETACHLVANNIENYLLNQKEPISIDIKRGY